MLKRPSRFLRLLGVAGLLGVLLASAIGSTAYAQDGAEGAPNPDPDPPGQTAVEGAVDPDLTQYTIYFPWVGNEDESAGLGAANTSISIQNLDNIDTYIYIYRGDGGDSWSLAQTAWLAAGASKTFDADSNGIASGDGAPVAVTSYSYEETELHCEDYSERADAPETNFDPGHDVNGDGRCDTIEQEVILFDGLPYPDHDGLISVCVAQNPAGDGSHVPAPFWDQKTGQYVAWQTVDDLEALWLDLPNSWTRFGGLNDDGDCLDGEDNTYEWSVEYRANIGGYAKQAVAGASLPYTTTADSSVSGYNSINGMELDTFDQWYHAIVQTNCGPAGCWNTILRIANFSATNVAVTARFFPADDGSGSLQTGFQLQALVDGGETWNIDISDYVPEGWVGSVHVYSDGEVFSMVDRVKVGNLMWITNTGSSSEFEYYYNWPGALGNYALFAPDVRLDFYGWNTGINVANLVLEDNNISIQYFNLLGNATGNLTQRLAPHGMTYFYDPSVYAQDNSVQDPATDPNADVIGSAIIWSDYPVAAVIDATKYPETTTDQADPNVGQAMSYSATANVYNWQAFPLVQKGNPADGMGATSGINMMNPNAVASQATVWWINPSGFGADNFGMSTLVIPSFANGFFYTMTQHNLPNGF